MLVNDADDDVDGSVESDYWWVYGRGLSASHFPIYIFLFIFPIFLFYWMGKYNQNLVGEINVTDQIPLHFSPSFMNTVFEYISEF